MATSSRSRRQKCSRSPRLKTGSIAFTRATNASRTSSFTRPESPPPDFPVWSEAINLMKRNGLRVAGGGVGRKSGRRDRRNGLPRLLRVQGLRGNGRHRGRRVSVGPRDTILRESPRRPWQERDAPQSGRHAGGRNGSSRKGNPESAQTNRRPREHDRRGDGGAPPRDRRRGSWSGRWSVTQSTRSLL